MHASTSESGSLSGGHTLRGHWGVQAQDVVLQIGNLFTENREPVGYIRSVLLGSGHLIIVRGCLRIKMVASGGVLFV